MYYCKNCQCDECQGARLTHGPDVRAKNDALRVITKAGDTGLTRSELQKRSRPFRALDEVEQGATLDQLVAQGLLIEHTFKPVSGRGKSRNAYLAISQ